MKIIDGSTPYEVTKGRIIADLVSPMDPQSDEDIVIHVRQYDVTGKKRAVRLIVPQSALVETPEAAKLKELRIDA